MKQEIIDKLKLKPTEETFGVSYVQKVIVYSVFDDIFCVAANSTGYPDDKFVMFFSKIGRKYIKMTNEIIMELPYNEIILLLNHKL